MQFAERKALRLLDSSEDRAAAHAERGCGKLPGMKSLNHAVLVERSEQSAVSAF